MPRRTRHLPIALFVLGSIACEDESSRARGLGIAARSLSTVPVVSAEVGTDPPILGPSNEVQRYSAVATNGTDHLAVWSDARRGGGVWGSRIDANGVVLDETGFVIAQDHWLVEPEVAFDGSSYVATWGSQLNPIKGVYASRVTPSGLVLDDPPRVVSLLGETPRITGGSVGSLLVWNEVSGAQLEIRARLLGQDGKLLGSSATSITNDGAEVDVAFDGSTYLVVWRAGGQIRAARLSTTASLLDATPIVLDPAVPNGPTPSVAAGASGFLVWWMSALGARHARVSKDGSVLDVPAIESILGRPDIGFDGSSFLAVLGATGQRIAATGELLGETFPRSEPREDATDRFRRRPGRIRRCR